MTILRGLGLAALLIGCQGGRTSGVATSPPDAAGEAGISSDGALVRDLAARRDLAPGAVCSDSLDCPVGFECLEHHGCPRQCVSMMCSAAPPMRVCGCDGRVRHYAPGCGGAYAWDTTYHVPYEVSMSGQPCNPEGSHPGKWTFNIEGLGFEAHEGKRVVVVANGQSRTTTIANGAFREVVQGVPLHMTPRVFVDVDGDGLCTAHRDLSSTYVPQRFDIVALVRWLPLTPETVRSDISCP